MNLIWSGRINHVICDNFPFELYIITRAAGALTSTCRCMLSTRTV